MKKELFLGRQKEIDEIITRVKFQNQSSAVLGDSGFGKTMLLKHLSSPAILRTYKLPVDHYIVVLFQCPDAASETSYSPGRFWQDIFALIEARVNQENLARMVSTLKAQSEFDYFIIENFFYEAKRENLHTILLLDDFDNLLANPNFDQEFLWSLKNLANNKIDYNFGLVVSSLHRLSALCHDSELMTSPFFNIFSNVPLGPFHEEESLKFLESQFKSGPKSDSTHQEILSTLITQSNGIPLLLELLAQVIQQSSNKDQMNHIFAWEGKFRERIVRFIERCWQNSTDSEQKFLFQLAYAYFCQDFQPLDSEQMIEIQKKFKDGWKLLLQRGLCYHNCTVMELFPEIYAKFILELVLESPNHLEPYKNVASDYMSIIKLYDIKYDPDYQFLFE